MDKKALAKSGLYYNEYMELIKSLRLPALLLTVMFALMLGSSLGDSLTTDEQAHIPAGYSYVRLLDFRLNPEHPPLVKALAGFPLLFLDLNFPTDIRSWDMDVNGQWDQGRAFIFESGNDPEKVIFWARLPMMLLTLLLGGLFYWFAKSYFGRKVAALALFIFVLSPTILAHGRLVTTDIGASIGFLIGTWTFLRFLDNPNSKNIFVAGLAFGIAELLKYSTFLLVPIYAILLIFWAATRMQETWRERTKVFLRLAGKSVIIGVIGLILIWLVYGAFTFNYPMERQYADSQQILTSFGNRSLVNAQLWLASHEITRPLAHYFLGLLMVVQRAAGGNTAYFMGEVANTGSRLYFPVVYLTKETLPFLILGLLALGLSLQKISQARPWGLKRVGYWLQNNFTLFAALFFVVFYWLYSMKTPLNIGIRHVLPTFPFIYIAVSRELVGWLRGVISPSPANWREWASSLYRTYIAPIPRYIFVSLLLLWLIIETVLAYPSFLSYYNELAGGTVNGYKIAVDSNYDWGQDLKRLRSYLEKNSIQNIQLDYFGGSQPQYYLGERFEPWWSAKGPASGYFAISATLLQGATQPTAPYFTRKPEDSYSWLAGHEPIGRAGYSIFIYKIP